MQYYIEREPEINQKIFENQDLREGVRGIDLSKMRSVTIFATGSSANAAHGARIYMQHILGIPVDVKEPSLAMHYDHYFNDQTLYIAISQGGHSYSVVQLVKFLQDEEVPVFVMTSDLKSPLAQISKHVIPFGMEKEEMPYVTAGYTATILLLWLIALEIAIENQKITPQNYQSERDQIQQTLELADQVIQRTNNWYAYAAHQDHLLQAERFVFISYGASYGVALEAETKFSEILHLPCHGHELEEYMHGPYLALDPKDILFLIDPAGKLTERMGLLRQFLDRHMDITYQVGMKGRAQNQDLDLQIDLPEYFAPLVMTIPFHLMSYYLSEAHQYDLTQSFYPDFDEITYSKI